MNPVWLHLMVNHIAIIGTLIGLVIVIVGLFMKNTIVKNVGLVVFIITGLMIYVANLTGEAAQETVKKQPGVSEQLIKYHEETAEAALSTMSIAIVFGALALFYKPRNSVIKTVIMTVFIIVSLAAFGVVLKTGHDGGLIRRPDLATEPLFPTIQHQKH